ncbi:hypothetical protein CC80DRAFT_596516 [Byssothecium circinans]|uniref:Uncharacterized protein n=1 Tax=Byssothecium circinans TaxID=147558 RepID=A0A6A5TL29_9PLEO|nr:hypothetical protein CC80DRAFT_596516 [Byssothecium circinans]
MSCKNDCASLPSSIKAKPDIAGIGILLSFALAAALTVFIASFWWYIDLIESAEKNRFSLGFFNGSFRDSLRAQATGWLSKDKRRRWARNTQQLILALSDQQLATGVALLVATQMRICKLTSYHYRTAVLLTFVPISVHCLAIRTLAPTVAIPRSFAMLVHAGLLIFGYVRVYSGGVGSVNGSQRADVRWPISCTLPVDLQALKLSKTNWPELGVGDSDRKVSTMFLSILIIMIVGNLTYTWRRLRKSDEQSDSVMGKAEDVFTSFFLNFAVAIASIIFSIASVLKLRAQVRPYLESNEDDWSFGQIMAILLLVVLLFLVLESISDTSKASSGNGRPETLSQSVE